MSALRPLGPVVLLVVPADGWSQTETVKGKKRHDLCPQGLIPSPLETGQLGSLPGGLPRIKQEEGACGRDLQETTPAHLCSGKAQRAGRPWTVGPQGNLQQSLLLQECPEGEAAWAAHVVLQPRGLTCLRGVL